MKHTHFKGTSKLNRMGRRTKASFGHSDTNYGSLVEFSNVWMRRCFQSRFIKTLTNQMMRRKAKQDLQRSK